MNNQNNLGRIPNAPDGWMRAPPGLSHPNPNPWLPQNQNPQNSHIHQIPLNLNQPIRPIPLIPLIQHNSQIQQQPPYLFYNNQLIRCLSRDSIDSRNRSPLPNNSAEATSHQNPWLYQNPFNQQIPLNAQIRHDPLPHNQLHPPYAIFCNNQRIICPYEFGQCRCKNESPVPNNSAEATTNRLIRCPSRDSIVDSDTESWKKLPAPNNSAEATSHQNPWLYQNPQNPQIPFNQQIPFNAQIHYNPQNQQIPGYTLFSGPQFITHPHLIADSRNTSPVPSNAAQATNSHLIRCISRDSIADLSFNTSPVPNNSAQATNYQLIRGPNAFGDCRNISPVPNDSAEGVNNQLIRCTSRDSIADLSNTSPVSSNSEESTSSEIPSSPISSVDLRAQSPVDAAETTHMMCRYGAKCYHKACQFNHPYRSFCEEKNSCMKITCPFNHHSAICKSGSACTYGKRCKFRHPMPTNGEEIKKKDKPECIYGVSCVRPSCRFRHPTPVLLRREITSESEQENKSPEQEATEEATEEAIEESYIGQPLIIETPRCKFGLKCYKGSCPYIHPPGDRVITYSWEEQGYPVPPHIFYNNYNYNYRKREGPLVIPPGNMVPEKRSPTKPGPKENQERDDQEFQVEYNYPDDVQSDAEESESENFSIDETKLDLEDGEFSLSESYHSEMEVANFEKDVTFEADMEVTKTEATDVETEVITEMEVTPNAEMEVTTNAEMEVTTSAEMEVTTDAKTEATDVETEVITEMEVTTNAEMEVTTDAKVEITTETKTEVTDVETEITTDAKVEVTDIKTEVISEMEVTTHAETEVTTDAKVEIATETKTEVTDVETEVTDAKVEVTDAKVEVNTDAEDSTDFEDDETWVTTDGEMEDSTDFEEDNDDDDTWVTTDGETEVTTDGEMEIITDAKVELITVKTEEATDFEEDDNEAESSENQRTWKLLFLMVLIIYLFIFYLISVH